MHTAENSETSNGRHNMGYLYDYLIVKQVPDNLITVALAIGRRSLGFCRATTNTPAEHGGNNTMTQWSNKLGISKSKFRETIKKLVTLKVLTVHKGSLYRNGGGSYPDYYSIIFDKDTQIKHSLFFNLDGVKTSTNTKETVILDYFKDGLGGVFPLKIKGKASKQWVELVESKTRKTPSTDEEWVEATPTIEEIKNGKYTINKG